MRAREPFVLAWIFSGVVLACLAGYVYLDPNRGIPRYSELREARGVLIDYRSSRGRSFRGVEFRLDGEERVFHYPPTAGSIRQITEALARRPAPHVDLKYEAYPEQDWKGRLQGEVWEISFDGKPGRSFEEIREVQKGNTWFGRFLCTLFGLIFLYYAASLWIEWLRKRSKTS